MRAVLLLLSLAVMYVTAEQPYIRYNSGMFYSTQKDVPDPL